MVKYVHRDHEGTKRLRAIEYFAPATIEETISLLAENGEGARVLAGGTDIIAQLHGGRRWAERLVDVKEVLEVNVRDFSSEKGLVLGSAVPCHRIYKDQSIVDNYPGLIDAASMLGGVQIQARASLGGNLCNAAPSADGIPPLIVLKAVCVIAGPKGIRRVPVEHFCVGPGETVIESGEVLVSFEIPPPVPRSGSRYLRFIPRNEMDIAVAGVAVSVVLDETKRKVVSARFSLAAVASTPLLVEEAAKALEDCEISDECIERAALLAKGAARPIDDMRGTEKQRKHLVYVLTKRALHGAIQRAGGTVKDV